MNRFALAILVLFFAGTAHAGVPLFAAKCGPNINADSNPKGQVYVNGKVAKLINRPDGQVTAQSAGVYVDITPQGNEPPRITYTDKDKNFGTCDILSFAPPAAATGAATHSERAGHGQHDARTIVKCAMGRNTPMADCNATVTRDPGGMATVVVTRPDGRTRAIFFENGKPLSADLSQADGDMTFKGSKRNDIYYIQAGSERYEIVEAVVIGG